MAMAEAELVSLLLAFCSSASLLDHLEHPIPLHAIVICVRRSGGHQGAEGVRAQGGADTSEADTRALVVTQ